jgi:hypothetical protein
MNSYLKKLSFPQLLDLFIYVTKEFISALESESSFKELRYLRDQIKAISKVIEEKKLTLPEGS